MKTKVLSLPLILLAATIVTGMQGGCGSATSESSNYYYPNWIPDGRIICEKIYTKSKEIAPGKVERIETKYYVTAMNDDGSNEQNLFEVSSEFKEITCSPTGELIAYITTVDGKMVTANYSGTSKTTLPNITGAEYLDWSPDASKIIYSNSSRELHVVNSDGTNDSQLATSAEAVAWRVGEKIVYEDSYYNRIYASNSDGSSKETIATISLKPQITNSGRVIYRGYGNQIESVKIDGTDKQLLFGGYERTTLRLSFDNTKIAGSDRSEGIWIVNIDGSDSKQIR